jgi:hypothetical protein
MKAIKHWRKKFTMALEDDSWPWISRINILKIAVVPGFNVIEFIVTFTEIEG